MCVAPMTAQAFEVKWLSHTMHTLRFTAPTSPRMRLHNANNRLWTLGAHTMTSRSTRSRSRQPPLTLASSSLPLDRKPAAVLKSERGLSPIVGLPESLATATTGLGSAALKLLKLKQTKLQDPASRINTIILAQLDGVALDNRTTGNPLNASVAQAIRAVLVFAQEEAGTAVCISPDGLLLTCAHCVGETEEDLDLATEQWLLFASGLIVSARCIAWDSRRDLALLQIVAAQNSLDQSDDPNVFPSVSIREVPLRLRSRLVCVGHPGSEDLEAATTGIATGYDVLHVSEGRYHGIQADQDPQDNSEIGALKHNCWTYWGHSGAPLLGQDGELVGLHSSWDEETGMRRGIALVAIQAFLREHTISTAAIPFANEPEPPQTVIAKSGASKDDAIEIN